LRLLGGGIRGFAVDPHFSQSTPVAMATKFGTKLDIRPIVTLNSLAALYKSGRCKQGAIIFHGGRVVVNFVQKFVAMATGVAREKFK